MLRKEDFMMIQALAQRGLYLCDIATQVGVHPRTERRPCVRTGGAVGWIHTGPTLIGSWPKTSGTRS
jgi:hypothetical protein